MKRLVEALNACWLPHFPGQAPITLADFKRDIRERQVWCSSCMIAFDGAEPIGVLIGAKRPDVTLVDRIAVRPDRMRREHGRHLLESLCAKLEILGPPRIVAEIPEAWDGASAFFEACGFARGPALTDWVLEDGARLARLAAGGDDAGRFVVPTTAADLHANRLLESHPDAAWDRDAATLLARADPIAGFGLATVDRIEAFVLYRRSASGIVIDALRCPSGDDREACIRLLGAVVNAVGAPLTMPRMAAAELSSAWLQDWGFRPEGRTSRFSTKAAAR